MRPKRPNLAESSLLVAAGLSLALSLSWRLGAAAQAAEVPPGAAYAWAPVNAKLMTAADPRLSSPELQTRLRTAIEAALAAKGFHKVAADAHPQLIATYHVGLTSKTKVKPQSMVVPTPACASGGCNGGWGIYGPPQMRNVKYETGHLMLDLVDASSGKLVWRNSSAKSVVNRHADPARLKAMIVEMTASLPGPPTR